MAAYTTDHGTKVFYSPSDDAFKYTTATGAMLDQQAALNVSLDDESIERMYKRVMSAFEGRPTTDVYKLAEDLLKGGEDDMRRLTRAQRKTLDADTQALLELGVLEADLTLSSFGIRFVADVLLQENLKKIAAAAREELELRKEEEEE